MTASAGPPLLATGVDPVNAAICHDLSAPVLLAASDDGRYGVHSYSFPIVLAWLQIQSGRLGFRLDCVDYPRQAPAGRPWDLCANSPLPVSRWPVDGRAGKVLRADWSPGNGDAPYLACDRVALRGHPDWLRTMPDRAWNSTRTISSYLEQLQDALYGARLPVA
jgi:hypothetical protein